VNISSICIEIDVILINYYVLCMLFYLSITYFIFIVNSVQIIKDLVTLFPVIRDWIAEFLMDIKDMTASEIGRNMLIEQVSILYSILGFIMCLK